MKKDPTHIDQKLLVLYLLDEISQQGRSRVEAWLSESPENRAFFGSLEKTWAQTGSIDPASIAFDTGRAWERMAGRIRTEEEFAGSVDREPGARGNDHRGITGLSTRAMNIWISLAALLMLGVVSVVFTRHLSSGGQDGYILASAVTVVQDTLSDGSSVVLNTHSELEVPRKFAGNTRTVKLRGEAFFEVQPDPEKPFIIEAGAGTIRVLGTAFQVRAFPGSDLEVYVESGTVELSVAGPAQPDSASVILKAGERGRIRPGSGLIGQPAGIGPDELFWANRKLIFQETKLSLVFDLLKKHYNARIEVKNDAVLDCLLSATFTDETIGQILEVVAASFSLELTKEQEKFIFNGKGCGHEVE